MSCSFGVTLLMYVKASSPLTEELVALGEFVVVTMTVYGAFPPVIVSPNGAHVSMFPVTLGVIEAITDDWALFEAADRQLVSLPAEVWISDKRRNLSFHVPTTLYNGASTPPELLCESCTMSISDVPMTSEDPLISDSLL